LAFKPPLIARSTKIGNMRGRGYWRESDGESLTPEEAYDIWARYAYDILIGVARSYHAVIEYGALAEEAQAASGVRTSVHFRHWIGKVLRRLVDRCHDEGVPPLTALVVHSTDGKVGYGYWAVLEVAGNLPSKMNFSGSTTRPQPGSTAIAISGLLFRWEVACQHWRLACASPSSDVRGV
jgi:hypothetical protein